MTNMESVEVVNKRDITCCFTGHRRIPSEKQGIITERLRDELIKLIEQGYVYFGAGGALGFDTIAAQVVLELKGTYPQIKLILVLPCKTQTRGWSKEAIEVYEDIKGKCDKYVYSSEDYDSSCMFKRNRHLIDNSSTCVCYLTESSGGTAYTVDYGKRSGLRIINVA